MGTRYAVVKGVMSADLADMKTAAETTHSGTFKKYDTVGLDFDAEFPTNALGLAFAATIAGVGFNSGDGYTDIHWDVYPHFRNIGQMH